MKAIHSFGPKDIRVVDVPEPVPQDGQVLVQVHASGICGSDKWLWHHPEPVYRIIGHEIAGEVLGVGSGVLRLRIGDRVAINNVVGCGHCPACRAGVFVKCPSWDGERDVNGGFGEQVVAPERNCMKLRDEIDYETGAQIFDNFGTPFSALQRARIEPGDDIFVSGCGPIGLATIILAKLIGAFVIATDPLPTRRELATSFGADLTLSPNEDIIGMVRDATSGAGVRVALECSGKSPSYPMGLSSLRIGGTFMAVGEGARIDLSPSDQLIRRHLAILGSWYSSMHQGQVLQDWIVQSRLSPRLLVSHRAPLTEFPALFRIVCDHPDRVIKALIVNS